jgi:hypothetical protein
MIIKKQKSILGLIYLPKRLKLYLNGTFKPLNGQFW